MTYHFYLKKRKLKKLCKKAFEKLVANLHDKANYVILFIHKRNLKQALNNKLVLKKVDRVIKFNRNTWLKPYINMNTDLTKKAKNDFEKDFYKLMINEVFGRTMKMWENIDILNWKRKALFGIWTKL